MKPFLIWVGSKNQNIRKLRPFYPKIFNDYYEPFLGSGAVFLDYGHKGKHCFLSDKNKNLIHAWKTVQRDPEDVINTLEKNSINNKEEFYKLVDLYNTRRDGGLYLYINRFAFGGRMRSGKHGNLVASYGNRKINPVPSRKNMMKIFKRLQNTTIKCQSYDKIQPQEGDFVYLDPPYYGSYHKAYSKNLNFQGEHHNKQFKLFKKWSKEVVS